MPSGSFVFEHGSSIPRRKLSAAVVGVLLLSAAFACATDYEVGPNRRYANVDQVPWEVLVPGDRVLIHWRPAPFKGKWVVCRRGTADRPITIVGVPGPNGELPVVDGQTAVTSPTLNFWNEARGVVKIGGANVPEDTMPAHIVIENLEIRGGRPPYRFIGRSGVTAYAKNAAAIYVEKAEHLVIRNCVLRDSGNGLFIGEETSDVLVERCRIEGNGIEGSMYEHNVYTSARGITFQFNSLGPLRPGCAGSNLKDRSAGLVVRYNWIEGGNRQLDLVDAEDTDRLRSAPEYRETFVYGNVLIERDGDGNNQIVHYGGDSGSEAWYRKGTLYFYHNTVVSQRKGTTTLFRLSTNDERLDCRNNIFYTVAPGRLLALLDDSGRPTLSHNWFKSGWVVTHEWSAPQVIGTDDCLTGETPGFADFDAKDLKLTASSPCVDAATELHFRAKEANPVLYEFPNAEHDQPPLRDHQKDIGAFEFR